MAMAVKGALSGPLSCPAGLQGVRGIFMQVFVVVEDCNIVAGAPAYVSLLCRNDDECCDGSIT